MKFKLGGLYGEPVQVLDTQTLFIVSEDGRDAFRITLLRDAPGFEVNACGVFKESGTLYNNRSAIHPAASNCFEVRSLTYDAPGKGSKT